MKCDKCGHENKGTAKFCSKCGNPMNSIPTGTDSSKSDNSKSVIIVLIIVIIVLVGVVGYFAFNSNFDLGSNDNSDDSQSDSSLDSSDNESPKTTTVSKSKSWESIGSYSGSGSGSQTIKVPEGKIKVELTSFPIKNYATNHLYVSGSNGKSGGVDWGPESAVESRSDSFTYTSDSEETFTIDYYETVSWNVEFYRYQ